MRPFNGYSMVTLNFLSGKSSIDNSKNNSVLYSNSIEFDYSYDLIKPETWFIGPYLGIKFSNYKLVAVSKNSISPLTTYPIEEFMHINNSPLANLGVKFDKKMHLYIIDFYFGLKAGYNINLSQINWNNTNGKKLDNIPIINLSGITIGFNLRIELDEIKIDNK